MDTVAQERGKLVGLLPFDRKELARRADCSTGTLSDWINDRRPVKKHLHDAIMREIEMALGGSGIERAASASELSGVEIREETPEYLTIAECKEQLKLLKVENAQLRAALHALTAPKPERLSSKPTAEMQEALDAADAVERHQRSKP